MGSGNNYAAGTVIREKEIVKDQQINIKQIDPMPLVEAIDGITGHVEVNLPPMQIHSDHKLEQPITAYSTVNVDTEWIFWAMLPASLALIAWVILEYLKAYA